MALKIARANGSVSAWAANTRAISGIAGETRGVASNAIAVAPRMTNKPCRLICGWEAGFIASGGMLFSCQTSA